MERKINYILSADGVSPSEKLCGGIQGENRATAITVTPNSELLSAIEEQKSGGNEVYCQFDVLSETGEFFEGEKRGIANISEPFYLTEEMTASGLDVTVIVKIGVLDRCFYKAQIKLYFEECPTYKTLNLKKKDELQRFEEKAEELFSLLEQKAEDAERKLDVKCSQAASSAAVAAGQLEKMIAFNQSAKESSESAAESEAAARAAAEAAEKDFETVKRLFSSATENINNHNFDPTAHADIRGLSQEIIRYVSRVNETAERTAEFAESHNIDAQSHKDIRNDVEKVRQSLASVVGTTQKTAEFVNLHNTDATSHADIREQIGLANGRIDQVEEDFNLFEKEVADAIAKVGGGGAEKWKQVFNCTLDDNLATELRYIFDKPYKKIRFKIIFKGDKGTTLSGIRFKRSKDDGSSHIVQNYLKLNAGALSATRYFYGTASFDVDGSIIVSDGGLGTGVAALCGNPGTYGSDVIYEEERQNFPEFYFYLGGSIAEDGTLSGNVLGAGTTIQVWGCE